MGGSVRIGWREWVGLPQLGVDRISVKVDTGARSSSLHAFNVEEQVDGKSINMSFDVHPLHGDDSYVIRCTAPLIEYRNIRSSNGEQEERPVVRVVVQIDGESWPIDLTLTNRDSMGFRMLLGREAIRGRFLVDPGRSFLIRDLVDVSTIATQEPGDLEE